MCIVYCVPGIRSIIYWVLGHGVLGPYALDATSRATTELTSTLTMQNSDESSSSVSEDLGERTVYIMTRRYCTWKS